jgi:hypothetical protein
VGGGGAFMEKKNFRTDTDFFNFLQTNGLFIVAYPENRDFQILVQMGKNEPPVGGIHVLRETLYEIDDNLIIVFSRCA